MPRSLRVLLLATLLAVASSPVRAQLYERVFPDAITEPEQFTSGGAWGDVNGDGWEDLVITNWFNQKNALYLNLGNGEFKWIEDAFPFNDVGNSSSSRWVDVENDGDLDLFITNVLGPAFFYLNKEGTLTKDPTNGLVTEADNYRYASFADYDNDWDLDALLTTPPEFPNVLYKNNGPGAFKPVNSGHPVQDVGDTAAICWGDPDDDGDQDLFVGTLSSQNDFLYWNRGEDGFEKETESEIVKSGGTALSCAWVDVDNDGDVDLFTTNQGGSNRLFRNEGGGRFVRDLQDPLVSGRIGGFGAAWGDVDNDGDLDVFVANREGANRLFLNQGGTFEPAVKELPSIDEGLSISGAMADYDRDGYLDLFVANDGPANFLYHNNGGNNAWISLRLVGDISNSWGIGSTVRVYATIGGKPAMLRRDLADGTDYSQSTRRVHVGLGDAKIIDKLVVEWPSGLVNSYENVPVNQFFDVVEGDDTPLPVTLASFTAAADGDAIAVAWTTAGERNNAGFDVQLAAEDGPFETLAHVAGAGTTTTPQAYSARLTQVAPGRYRVRLRQLDFDGAFAVSDTVAVTVAATARLTVEPAYPNPFNPSTALRFALSDDGPVRVALYDTAGRELRVLFEGEAAGGRMHEVVVDGATLASGLYLVRIEGNGRVASHPVMLVK